MYTYLQTKSPNFGTFWRALEWNMLVYIFYGHLLNFTAICYILRLFGIFSRLFVTYYGFLVYFHGYLVYFTSVWYILMLHIWYILTILEYCRYHENVATLL
jgi:hypothetical protein